ncbi:fimbrial protein [Lelliottia amnigena]|uniref:Fimbrial protein n=1 Tax=Lelliottia amnigena TaxID=61646 RepID=A0ABU7UH12_LELAM
MLMKHLKSPFYFMGFLLLLIIFSTGKQAFATITGVQGFVTAKGATICYPATIPPYSEGESGTFRPVCTLTIPANVYMPKSGMYKISALLGWEYESKGNALYIDATKPLAEQDLYDGKVGNSITALGSWSTPVTMCYNFFSVETGQYYSVPGASWSSCAQSPAPPLPPTPPAPEVACHINNDVNTLNVNFTSIDRNSLPVEPTTGEIIHKTIPVNCTGGDATFNMVFNYTSLTVNGTDVIQTSTNGVGVTLIYNNRAIPPTTVTSLAFPEGANTIDLGFEIVRDSSVNIKDIATGAFSASAVMVLTQM